MTMSSSPVEPKVLLGGLAIVESPRWHDGRLWFAHWVRARSGLWTSTARARSWTTDRTASAGRSTGYLTDAPGAHRSGSGARGRMAMTGRRYHGHLLAAVPGAIWSRAESGVTA